METATAASLGRKTRAELIHELFTLYDLYKFQRDHARTVKSVADEKLAELEQKYETVVEGARQVEAFALDALERLAGCRHGK